MKQLCYFSLMAFWLISCSKPIMEESDTKQDFSFGVVDSLDVDVLGSLMLVDVSPKGKHFVFFDFSSRGFVFTDDSGEVPHAFSKTGDIPDAHGFLLEFPGFVDENSIALSGMNGIFLYDLKGNMLQRLAHPESLEGASTMSFVGKGMETTRIGGKTFLLSNSVRTRGTYPGEQQFYDSFKALELIDIDRGEFLEIVPFEKGSRFLDGNGYFASDYAPALEAVGDKLYIALGGDPKLYVYTLGSDGAILEKSVSLDIPGFEKLPITSRDEFYEGAMSVKTSTPSLRNIHVVDEYVLIQYYGGFSENKEKEINALMGSGDSKGFLELYNRYEKEVSKGILVLDRKNLHIVGNVPLPEGVNNAGFASSGDYLWMERSGSKEKEEDFLRIYKVKLQKHD
ncbi:hypothetical protein [Mongoliitalea lutea]|nr:hypothetical protein [Mongoliitalea lutea]